MKLVNEKLQEFENFIKNKTVAIIGLESSNLPLLDYFCDKGAIVTVFDNRTIDEIDKTILDKITDRCIKFSFGEHNLINLVGYEIIFKGPNCPNDVYEIKSEQLRGAVVISEIEMVLEIAPCKIIGVTGDNGAETTAKLIYSILKENGNKCYLGGNIGDPLFAEIGNMEKDSIIVLQANSTQLTEIQSSPQIAVITNIEKHEDNEFSNIQEINDMENIFKFQNEEGITVLNFDNDIKKTLISDIPGKIKYFSVKSKIDNGVLYDNGIIKKCDDGVRRHILTIDDAISLDGIDNYRNICAAIAATTGIADPAIQARAIIKYSDK